ALLENVIKLDDRLVYFADQEGFFVKNGSGDNNRQFIDPLAVEKQIEAGKTPIRYPITFENIEEEGPRHEAARHYERNATRNQITQSSSDSLSAKWNKAKAVTAPEPESQPNPQIT
ncbi:MAG: hypothetical protein AAF182_04435, partial [Pseudomonadota bacterium]